MRNFDFSFYAPASTAILGDVVEVEGTVSRYSGEIFITSPEVTVIGNNPNLFPFLMTPDEILASYENVGKFVSVTGIVDTVRFNKFSFAAEENSLVVYFGSHDCRGNQRVQWSYSPKS